MTLFPTYSPTPLSMFRYILSALLSGNSHDEGKGGNIEILAGASSGDEINGPTVFLHGGEHINL